LDASRMARVLPVLDSFEEQPSTGDVPTGTEPVPDSSEEQPSTGDVSTGTETLFNHVFLAKTNFFIYAVLGGWSTDGSSLGKGNLLFTVYSYVIQFILIGVGFAVPVVYWATDGYGLWRDLADNVPRATMILLKVLDMLMATVTAVSFITGIFLLNSACARVPFITGMCRMNCSRSGGNNRMSALDAVWTTPIKKNKHRIGLWTFTIQLCLMIVFCEAIIWWAYTNGAQSVLLLGVVLPSLIGFISCWVFPMIIAMKVITDVEVPTNEDGHPQAIARFVQSVQSIQTDWLGQDGILQPFLKCATVSASTMLAFIWLDVLAIAMLSEHGYDAEKSQVVEGMSISVLVHMFFCSIVLGWAVIPPLTVTANCEQLCQGINDLRGKLTYQLASGMPDGQRMHDDIFLVDELQTYLQNLNHKQGMGCAMFGFRMSVPLVKALGVAMATVAIYYLPNVFKFYQIEEAAEVLGNHTAISQQ